MPIESDGPWGSYACVCVCVVKHPFILYFTELCLLKVTARGGRTDRTCFTLTSRTPHNGAYNYPTLNEMFQARIVVGGGDVARRESPPLIP